MTVVPRLFRPLLVAGILTACSSTSGDVDYDPAFDFARLTTYAWADRAAPAGETFADEASIRETVDRALSARGYRRAAAPPADFLVAFEFSVRDRAEIDPVEDVYAGSGGAGWWDGERRGYYQYSQAALLLRFIDPRTRNVIWRGQAATEVPRSRPPGDPPPGLAARIRELLARFPPGRD